MVSYVDLPKRLAEANKRIAELEAALRRMTGPHTLSPQFPNGHLWALGCDACNWREIGLEALKSLGNQAGTAPSDAVSMAPTPRGSLPNILGTVCPKCGEELIDGHHKPDPVPPFF